MFGERESGSVHDEETTDRALFMMAGCSLTAGLTEQGGRYLEGRLHHG